MTRIGRIFTDQIRVNPSNPCHPCSILRERCTRMMELRQVTKVYQQGRRTVQAVRGVSLRVEGGEYVAIMGPSGSGKSTLMHLLGALDTPTTGQAFFDGRDLQRMSDTERALLRRNRIGFVFQFFNLLPTLTAVENVALPLLLGGRGRKAARGAALAALDHVGLTDRADHFPEEMSGGEMQRVAVARRWSPSRRPSCATSRPATSTRPPARKSCRCCGPCRRRASGPWSW